MAVESVKSVARAPVTAAALAASGLILGLGAPPASADAPLEPPILQSLRLDGSQATVTFKDLSADEQGFTITVRERDNPDRTVLVAPLPGGGAPGTRRVVSQVVNGLPAGVPLCAHVQATGLVTSGGVAELAGLEKVSPPSNTVCADPVAAADAPDLALENIRGKAEQQWTTVQNQTPAYLVAFRNPGGDASDITVDVNTSGVATLGDQAAVAGGWNAAGFTCAPRPPSGGEAAAMRCTGGKLAKGQATNPAVIVKFTGPGQGTIHAQISGPGDTNSANNGTALGVRVL
jgi:hypothetical protein